MKILNSIAHFILIQNANNSSHHQSKGCESITSGTLTYAVNACLLVVACLLLLHAIYLIIKHKI